VSGRRHTRGRLVGVLTCLALLSVLACAKDPTSPRLTPPKPVASVDEAAVWSHDGQHIAFHRRVQSADGPPGVYLVSTGGGAPRLLAPGDFFWPAMLSFSPDDRFIAGISNFGLIIIDVENALVRHPLPPGIGAFQPDWSPRGDVIIYWRRPGFPATPDDSAGLYFLDPWSGSQRLFLGQGGKKLYGSNPLWTRDAEEITFINDVAHSLYIVRKDGTGLRVLASPGLYKYPLWYVRPVLGVERLLFSITAGPGSGDYMINRDGSGLERTKIDLGLAGVPSPDGSETVFIGTDPADSLSALFIRAVEDRTGASVRQLTHYSPPPSVVPGIPVTDPSPPDTKK
jgi:hypothetical protein